MCSPDPPPPPDYAGAARAQGEANLEATQYDAAINRPDEYDPWGSRTWTLRPGADPKNPQPGDYIARTSLTPDQQAILDANERIAQAFLRTGENALSRVGAGIGAPIDLGGLPQARTVSDRLPTLAGAPALPTDANAVTERVTGALLDRLRPELDRRAEQTRTQLIASGNDVGSVGYGAEMERGDKAANDAMLAAIVAGREAGSRSISDQLALRGQAVGEQGQLAGQLMSATGQDNALRIQALQELLNLRTVPINEVNALRTGSQVTAPQFGQIWNGANTAAAPVFDAMMARGAYDQNTYNQKMAGYNALLSGLAGMGGAWLGRK